MTPHLRFLRRWKPIRWAGFNAGLASQASGRKECRRHERAYGTHRAGVGSDEQLFGIVRERHRVSIHPIRIVHVSLLAIREPQRIVSVDRVEAHPAVKLAETIEAFRKIGGEAAEQLRP